jgi:hypothetical protein
MLNPEERVAFFDVIVALVRKVVHGDVRTGYLGLTTPLKSGARLREGGVGSEVSFFFGLRVDGRLTMRSVREVRKTLRRMMIMNWKMMVKRMKKKKRRRTTTRRRRWILRR